MATTKELLEEYQQKRQKIVQMASSEAIEKRHKKGQWTARERIDYFFDPGTFNEIGLFVKNRTIHFGMDKANVPAEGVVTGYGMVNGRPVVAFAEDYMAMAGTFGEYHGIKEIRAIDFAKEMG
ncbi:MAG TPA: methylmalonyl-CoA carboxyltransferase, partial [Dehalococcoidia bacterium]|nr:methylmalonyl-CoA carboxyltransferase [Dehalococcoidia bacterium]